MSVPLPYASVYTPADPARDAFAVSPSDTVNFASIVRGLYIGAAGDVVIVTPPGTAVTFASVPAGTVLPVQAIRVNQTLTNASSIVGLL
jgi:hypothetical protein